MIISTVSACNGAVNALAASVSVTEKQNAEIERLTGWLDLMKDEFIRISSCGHASNEIKQLGDRASKQISQNIPVIAQRDAAQAKLLKCRLLIGSNLEDLKRQVAEMERLAQSIGGGAQ